MKLNAVWTLVWDETDDLIPPLDEYGDGMLFLNEDRANIEADRQTDMYGEGQKVARVVRLETAATPGNCPKCDSPEPRLHPAVQHEGEVQPCDHEFHKHPLDQGTSEELTTDDYNWLFGTGRFAQ